MGLSHDIVDGAAPVAQTEAGSQCRLFGVGDFS
jgi:hypothetical protein